MVNPFQKRATEYLRDDAAFLSVVTPEPLYNFFEKHAKDGSLFDRLCMVIGTPGSGKTTIATLMQFGTVSTLLNNPSHPEYPPIRKALLDCQIVKGDVPSVLGCRIPMESEYRELWELPYDEEIKFGLLKLFLQSRAVISWVDSLTNTDLFSINDARIVCREGTQVALESIGGETLEGVLEKAREIERIVYDINAALVSPSENTLPSEVTAPYQPFDTIKEIVIDALHSLQPLVILDDVHALHPLQFLRMKEWLAKREMKVSRWMLMRLDAQTSRSVLLDGRVSNDGINSETTINQSREITKIWLQRRDDRASYRKKFRSMAHNMADNYLRLMPVFQRQSLTRFQDILNTKPKCLSSSKLAKLKKKIGNFQLQANISSGIRNSLENEVRLYLSNTDNPDSGEDVALAMLHILMNRYVKRVPQASLFDDFSGKESPVPSKPIKANSGVADGARIFLLHEFMRPYYYGIDSICDGSSENAEQFLQLAGKLVGTSEARIILGSSPELDISFQHRLLRERATEIIREWAFPKHIAVNRLCSIIAGQCVKKSLEPNASLDGGPNAFGIPQEEYEGIIESQPDLAHTIKFGVAYNALSIKPYHKTKNRDWALIELTGPFLIKSGLTLTRGGFLERRVEDLLTPKEEN